MKKLKLKPYTKIILSMLTVLLIGAILLWLPVSHVDGVSVSFLDAFFTSTSAVCVTGLSVFADLTAVFNSFGLFVLVVLMEIGGLGIMTITMFFAIIIGAKIGITDRFELKEILNQNSNKGMVRLILSIMLLSFSIQLIMGIVNIVILFNSSYGLLDSVNIGLFHAVSSFNNAGFDIFGGGNSMLDFADNIALNISTIISIVLGGLGFIVILDILSKLSKISRGKSHKFTIHTKVVLIMTFSIITIGTFLLKICMGENITWLEALFQCVTARTAGFETVDMNLLNMPAYMIMLTLMFIGANPCSTGGGIKTTTLFVMCVAILNFAKGQSVVTFNRKIENQTIFKAFTLFAMSIMYVALIIFGVSLFDSALGFKEIVFEVISAFATVGVSMGITSLLSVPSKLLICLTMFVGRVGPLTVINMLNSNWNRKKGNIDYVEEKMIIG